LLSGKADGLPKTLKYKELKKAMSLSHFDPLVNLRAFEDAFTRILSEPQTNRPWSPAVDILENENDLTFVADLPGVSLENIDVRVENQTLTITGERAFEAPKENTKGFHRIERNYGKFVRSFAVPNAFDTDKIAAGYRNGVLTVSLPKKEAAKPRQIKVEVAG
jgi:HSP20 family protein